MSRLNQLVWTDKSEFCFRLLCVFGEKYLIQEETQLLLEDSTMQQGPQCLTFSCSFPCTSGRGFIEVHGSCIFLCPHFFVHITDLTPFSGWRLWSKQPFCSLCCHRQWCMFWNSDVGAWIEFNFIWWNLGKNRWSDGLSQSVVTFFAWNRMAPSKEPHASYVWAATVLSRPFPCYKI